MGNKKIPKIRFNNFKIDWQQVKFKNLLNSEEGIRRGPFGSALKKELFVQNSEYVVYEQQNAIYDHFNTRYRISEEKYHELKKFILLPGDFIMSGAGTIGKISLIPEGIEKGVFNQALIRLRVNKNTDKEFFLQWMRSPEMQNKLTKANPASAMVNLVPMSEVKEWDVIVPSLDEQTAIGSLFRTLDNLLASYKDNLANYQSLKAAMLSKMFPKADQTVPEIRLDGFEGEWEINKLNKYLTVSKKKNTQQKFGKEDVLSVSGEVGIVNQIQFQGRSFAGVSVEMYSIVDTGNIVYTKSPLKANPYGIIKTNYGVPGIVSTLYAVYLPNENVFPGFVERYFENDLRLNSYLKPLVNKGAKNDMKVSDENALLGNVIFPKLEEQVAISDYFTNLDKFIQSHKDKISQLETLKKKLLQDMFV